MTTKDPMPVKTLEVLEILASAREGLGVTEISRTLNLSKSTVHRILTALSHKQYVWKDEVTRRYKLGFKLLLLSSQVLDSLELRQIARAELVDLANKSRETVHLVWLDGDEGVYIEKIDTPETIGLLSRIGKRAPLYSTAVGKAMLAFMSEERLNSYFRRVPLVPLTPHTIVDEGKLREYLFRVREQGFALDCEENREGVICVAAPIFQADGKVIAAVSISGPSFRFSVERAKELAPVVKEAAKRISRKLGFPGD
ncbi:transcriptional regulator, IclR family [Thermanaeromonas toyohensis ToBE]|uniref:Glycerol operon regulatory protein n=1 Tax=Thermanaeromonas toyohensis ToBE TaxID=698762 RepID=A0A1W1VVD5_9FIRM|nr:IclR family transcriptional regulator [Thermanaeromonas toyohensis]SMB97223.1 transcriptional regulator, IclR family [Thermanaeromonas toyohensis ToBE]